MHMRLSTFRAASAPGASGPPVQDVPLLLLLLLPRRRIAGQLSSLWGETEVVGALLPIPFRA